MLKAFVIFLVCLSAQAEHEPKQTRPMQPKEAAHEYLLDDEIARIKKDKDVVDVNRTKTIRFKENERAELATDVTFIKIAEKDGVNFVHITSVAKPELKKGELAGWGSGFAPYSLKRFNEDLAKHDGKFRVNIPKEDEATFKKYATEKLGLKYVETYKPSHPFLVSVVLETNDKKLDLDAFHKLALHPSTVRIEEYEKM